MQFAVAILNEGFDTFIPRVRLAEEVGFDRVCFGDSQSVFRETYVSHAAMALATRRASLWMTVSNPLTRHLAVTASAASTLSELSHGRFVLGLGTGDSALGNIGERPVSLATLRGALLGLRALWRGEPIEWNGKPTQLMWRSESTPALSIAAEGPRTLRLAGELCDEVCIGAGLDSGSVDRAINLVGEGAESAGRSLDDMKLWWFAKCNVASNRDEALRGIAGTLASSANHAFEHGFEGKDVPVAMQDRIRELRRRYDYSAHARATANPNADLVVDPHLLEFLGTRFAVAGSASEVAEQLSRLERLGVQRLFVTAIAERPEEIIEEFGRTVIPRFRGAHTNEDPNDRQARRSP